MTFRQSQTGRVSARDDGADTDTDAVFIGVLSEEKL